jgi:hypothetical protein
MRSAVGQTIESVLRGTITTNKTSDFGTGFSGGDAGGAGSGGEAAVPPDVRKGCETV